MITFHELPATSTDVLVIDVVNESFDNPQFKFWIRPHLSQDTLKRIAAVVLDAAKDLAQTIDIGLAQAALDRELARRARNMLSLAMERGESEQMRRDLMARRAAVQSRLDIVLKLQRG